MSRPPSPRRGPGRPAKPIERGTLIAIARRWFARQGYAGTSLRALADEAGLTKASLFHHFASKEALYMEALTSIVGELQGLVDAARERTDAAFLERLDRLGTLAVRYLGTNPDAARLLTRELMGGGPFMDRGGERGVQAILRATAEFLGEGMREGDIPTQDAEQLALSIAGLHFYLFASPEISGRFLGRDVFDEEHVKARTAAVLEQVRRLCGAPSN